MSHNQKNDAYNISPKTEKKIERKHNSISLDDIYYAFHNPLGGIFDDNRPEHKTEPPTRWFIGETEYGRKVKIAYIWPPGEKPRIKTAYEPKQPTLEYYKYINKLKGIEIDI